MKHLGKIKFKPAKFVEINDELINPERGWYQIHTFNLGDEIHMTDREYTLNKTDTLAFVLVDISTYRDKALDDEALNKLRKIFTFFRDYHLDMIVRVVYDTVGKCLETEPSEEAQILEHMTQLGVVLKEFAGEIFVYQGLLIGNWGEMHSSKFLSPGRLRRLSEVLLGELKDTAFLAVRRPAYVRILFPEGEDIRQTRVGIFDDAILASTTHLGTFGELPSDAVRRELSWHPKEELKYVSELCNRVPYGGEALWEDEEDELKEVRHSLSGISKYFSKIHVSYLNRIHDVKFIDHLKSMKWTGHDIYKGMNGYDYIGRHLGYRFVVRDASCKRVVNEDKLVRFEITVENVGYSRAFFKTKTVIIGLDEFGNYHQEDVSEWIDFSVVAPGERHVFACHSIPLYGKIYIRVTKEATKQSVFFANKRRDDAMIESALHLGTVK